MQPRDAIVIWNEGVLWIYCSIWQNTARFTGHRENMLSCNLTHIFKIEYQVMKQVKVHWHWGPITLSDDNYQEAILKLPYKIHVSHIMVSDDNIMVLNGAMVFIW